VRNLSSPPPNVHGVRELDLARFDLCHWEGAFRIRSLGCPKLTMTAAVKRMNRIAT